MAVTFTRGYRVTRNMNVRNSSVVKKCKVIKTFAMIVYVSKTTPREFFKYEEQGSF